MLPRAIASALAAALLLAAPAAWADRVALLPTRGGDAITADLEKSLTSLGHTLVPAKDVAAAIKAKVVDGVADTQEEYRAVGTATRADWVLAGSVEPAVRTERVELTACLVKPGRVESVAREVEKDRRAAQVKEMLAVLVRPEGIGPGALPWERGLSSKAPPAPPPPPPPPPKPTVAPVDGRAHVTYPVGSGGDVWPPYTGGKRGFVSALMGFSLAVLRPPPPAGVTAPASLGASWVALARGGYAVTDLGLEPFVELGGNLVGPRALWVAAGARWMLAPAMTRGADGVRGGAPFYIGPEILVGGFFQLGQSALASDLATYSSKGSARPVIGAALDLAYALAPSFQLEAELGNLRWVPGGGGSLITVGATFGAAVRF